MAELCNEHKTGTLLAVQRNLGEDGIQESFRSLSKPEACAEQKIWAVVEDNSPADMNITTNSTINIEK